MSEMKYPRRSVLKGALMGVAAIPVGAMLGRDAVAAPVMLDVNDPQAKALGYVEDAAEVDAKANPNFKVGQHCGNCLQFTAKPTDPEGPCNIFPGKHVAGKGWCKVWVKRS